MKYQVNNKGEQFIHYKINKWKTQDSFDILHDISENVTFVQAMDVVGNINNAVL